MHGKALRGKRLDKRYISIRNILIITLALNWLVAFTKIIYGLVIKSISVTADGFHSLSDGASNIVCLVGIWIASKPKDTEHPYGHKKYETFTSVFIAAILFVISFDILEEVIRRFFHPVAPNISSLSFALMLATMAINLCVMFYEHKRGKELNSDILISDSIHTKTDIYASASVLIALFAIRAGFTMVDLIAGVFISFLIAMAAIEIMKESSFVLCDGSPINTQRIEDVVKNIKGVKRCHKIRTRGRPDDVHIDLHVSVDTDMHVDKAHGISHRIQDEVKQWIPGVTDVIVHVEPL